MAPRAEPERHTLLGGDCVVESSLAADALDKEELVASREAWVQRGVRLSLRAGGSRNGVLLEPRRYS